MQDGCAGRFPPLCSTEFPEVVVYDFESNLATRGTDDRTFRWEDVYVSANYLFTEITASGEFENNSFTATTGVSYISTPTTINTTNYPHFNITGGYSVYIGTSGVYVTSGSLSGFNGPAFTANPIQGNQSIGLYCYSNSYPRIIGTGLPSLSSTESHQFYTQAHCNYFTGAGTPQLRAYIVGITGTATPVAYYNPASGAWTSSAPTGGFTIAKTGYTEIKYNFAPTGFPSASPTSYQMIVDSLTTGAFITVDDLHIDQYMKRNPFLDYILPTGYLIQMTPDLGWHDVLAMFDSNGKNTNPYLTTLGMYSVDVGNLTDNLDNSVSATIDQVDFDRVTNNKYKKYLWRAIAVSPNGAPAKGGLPQKFEFVGKAIEQDFSVTNVINDPTTSIKVIAGTKSPRMTILVNDEADHPGITYIDDYSWKLTIVLDTGTATIGVRGKDLGGAKTSVQYIQLDNKLFAQSSQNIWNVFDEHGLIVDVPRLPMEDNDHYRLRIKDASINRGGSTFIGVANSATRELGLVKISDALVLTIPRSLIATPQHDQVQVSVSSAAMRLRTDRMSMTETVQIDPVYLTASLSKKPVDLPQHVLTDKGLEIPTSLLSIDVDENFPSVKRIKVASNQYAGHYATITYDYYEELLFRDYIELGDLSDAISACVDHAGFPIVDCELNAKLSGNEDSLGLFLTESVVTSTTPINLAWSPIIIKRISDREFREYHSTDGTFRDTKFYEYVKELKSNSRVLWGSVQTDRDYWDAAKATDLSFDHIPTLFDPQLTYFYTRTGDTSVRIDSSEAWARGYVGNNDESLQNLGIGRGAFQPGVAHTHDLEPDVRVLLTKDVEPTTSQDNISDIRQNNNYVLFSGQR